METGACCFCGSDDGLRMEPFRMPDGTEVVETQFRLKDGAEVTVPGWMVQKIYICQKCSDARDGNQPRPQIFPLKDEMDKRYRKTMKAYEKELMETPVEWGSYKRGLRAMFQMLMEQPGGNVLTEHDMLHFGERFLPRAHFYISGKNVFVVHKKLHDILAKTSPEGLRLVEMKLPYDAFYVAFENNRIFDGFYYSKHPDIENPDTSEVSLLLIVREDCRVPGHPWMQPVTFTGDDVTLEFTEWRDGMLVPSSIRGIIGNTLAYLASPHYDPEVGFVSGTPKWLEKKYKTAKTRKMRKSVLKQAEEQGWARVKYLGGAFLREHGAGMGTGREVSPHWRRGHWRRQRVGKGRQDVRLTLIPPTIVRRDLGEPTKGRIYDVDGVC